MKLILIITGYGYHIPTTDMSRLFTIFYIFLGVYTVFMVIADVLYSSLNSAKEFLKQEHIDLDMKEQFKHHRRQLIVFVFAVVVVLFLGAITLMYIEDMTFITALYFAVETMTVHSAHTACFTISQSSDSSIQYYSV